MNLMEWSPLDVLLVTIDIFVVWFILYKLLGIIKGTRSVQLLKGIALVVVVRLASLFFDLPTLSWLTDQVMTWGFLAIIIIFQPEIRRALEHLGRGKIFTRHSHQEEEKKRDFIQQIATASSYLAKRRIGALISIEKETGMGDYIETGIRLDSKISSELLINIFIPNTPLHDGAVIIQDKRVAAAACYLPLSENPFISKELGTRHRAAIGISEVTDSFTIVISEETGAISVTRNGEINRNITIERLKELLDMEIFANVKQEIQFKWNWMGKCDE